MKRNRLYCGKCGARDSKLVYDGTGILKASCNACGAKIPLYPDVYGHWHPERVKSRVIAPENAPERVTE